MADLLTEKIAGGEVSRRWIIGERSKRRYRALIRPRASARERGGNDESYLGLGRRRGWPEDARGRQSEAAGHRRRGGTRMVVGARRGRHRELREFAENVGAASIRAEDEPIDGSACSGARWRLGL